MTIRSRDQLDAFSDALLPFLGGDGFPGRRAQARSGLRGSIKLGGDFFQRHRKSNLLTEAQRYGVWMHRQPGREGH